MAHLNEQNCDVHRETAVHENAKHKAKSGNRQGCGLVHEEQWHPCNDEAHAASFPHEKKIQLLQLCWGRVVIVITFVEPTVETTKPQNKGVRLGLATRQEGRYAMQYHRTI
jgi:hypothetical protein